RAHVDAADEEADVEMVPARQTRLAAPPERLAWLHLLPDLDADLRHMAVEREEPEAVVEDHHVAVDPVGAREDDPAGIARLDGDPLRRREVDPEVPRRVDRLALDLVGALLDRKSTRLNSSHVA